MSVAQKLAPMTETSCLVNVIHEILVDCWKKKIPSIAVCPTQKLEKIVGHDAAIPGFDKVLAFQFKAYLRRSYKPLDYFQVYPSQHATLRKYPLNCAFYVFPDYKTHFQMHKDKHLELLGQYYKILNNTWFVEVHSIPATKTRIERNDLVTRRIPSFNWATLSRKVMSCDIGFRIIKRNGRYMLEDTEERVVETIGIPLGSFSFFYTETNHVKPKKETGEKVDFTHVSPFVLSSADAFTV
jgi:hypothetical protein